MIGTDAFELFRARHRAILFDIVACRSRIPPQAAVSRTWNLLPVAWA